VDSNNDGQQNDGATGLNGVTVNLYDGGLYNFAGLKPGSYHVVFETPTGYVQTTANVGDDAGDSDAVNGVTGCYTLDSGENETTVDAGFLRTASLGDRLWVDTNADGQQNDGATGIVGATVTLIGGGADGVIGTGGDDTSATTVTGADGIYNFSGLNVGEEYQVQFAAPSGMAFTGQNVGDDASDSDVDAMTGKTQIVTLTSGEHNPTLDAGVYATASLGDKVWEDKDGDGQQDNGEPGIDGVTVRLYNCVTNELVATTTTANGGLYNFAGLKPGSYHVVFETPTGYVQTTANVGDDAGDSDAVNGVTGCYTLDSGENETTVDAGFLRTASLGDRLWVDTNADGQQNDGATGIVGATVTLIGGGADGVIGTGGDDTSATTVTGADGIYNFSGLNVGEEYQVQFAAPSGMAFTGQNVGDDASDSDVDAMTGKTQIVTLTSGEHNPTLDAGVYATASLGDKVWEDKDGDGQQDNGEPGIDGVTVRLYNCVTNELVATTTTANGGLYNFAGLKPGSYHVVFETPTGYVQTTANVGDDAGDSDAVNGVTGCYTLDSGENETTVDAGFLRTASLGDRLWVDTNADGQQNDGATGIVGATVTLIGGGADGVIGTGGDDTSATTVTGADGIYNFSGLNVGEEYQVQFAAPSGMAFTGQNVGDDASDSDVDAMTGKTQIVTLTSGEHNPTLDAGVYATASLGDRIWYDTNANGIQDTGENGVAGVSLSLMDGNQNVVSTTVTDGNGYYRFDNLTPGDYQVNIDESTLPAGYEFTTSNQGGDDAKDSDIIDTVQYPKAWGRMDVTTLSSGEVDLTWDAGIVQLLPGIDIEKTTNGSTNTNTIAPTYDNEDAANGAGVPILTAGSDVTWTYKVTNAGNTSFANSEIAIVDDNGTAANTADDMSIANGKITYQSGDDGDSVLEAGESWIYKATGTVQSLNTLGSATTINMAGSSSTDGSDGNSRSYSANGVTVNASAWSREKGGDTWAKAWLGTYGGGLGVTDSGEGSGGSDSHTVDNNVRDNYIVFQFSQDVVVDKAFLGYVVGDSDMTVYVGSSTTSITSMNNAVLNGMTLKEFNDTSSTSARWADFNAGNVSGNVLILAARDDGHSMDYFKVEQLVFQAVQSSGVYANTATVTVTGGLSDADLSHYKTTSAPPPALKSSIGDKVWVDTDSDGVQDSGEAGVAGVTVKLLNSAGSGVEHHDHQRLRRIPVQQSRRRRLCYPGCRSHRLRLHQQRSGR
jgi:hypothetical protein